jgi:hypothetical protein
MRTRVLIAWIAVGASAAAASAQSSAEPPVYRGRIVGVLDERTGEPVAGGEVRNLLNGLSAVTTSTGTLSLFFVDTAGGMLSFKKLGYEPQTMVVANSVRDTTPVTVILKPVGQVLPTVVTNAKTTDVVQYMSPALKGFEERRHQALGHFVSEAELRKNDVEKQEDRGTLRLAARHAIVQRERIRGVEYYAGGATMPPQYNGTDSGCGVLLLWTRER